MEVGAEIYDFTSFRETCLVTHCVPNFFHYNHDMEK